MISFLEARKAILNSARPARKEIISIKDALGRVLSEDVVSPLSHPLFDQSAVDGYGFRYEDMQAAQGLILSGEIRAGESAERALPLRGIVRVFTGAPVPSSADTVVMQENTVRKGKRVFIKEQSLRKGAHIRRRGEQIRAGEVVLQKGHALSAAAIGLLASLGIEKARVSSLPSVGIIATGSEFVPAGSALKPGEKYESNGLMLGAALRHLGINPCIAAVEDEPGKMTAIIEEVTARTDMTIITGGVSVGDYDFTEEALQRCGYDVIFHNVNQKPGKPMLFAQKGEHSVFGLPGNPRAVLLCYYLYVLPFIRAGMGCARPFCPVWKLPLAQDMEKKTPRMQFLSAAWEDEGLRIPDMQDSHMLKSLLSASLLVELPEGKTQYKKGDMVNTHLIGTW